jgi:hypothetical protein
MEVVPSMEEFGIGEAEPSIIASAGGVAVSSLV